MRVKFVISAVILLAIVVCLPDGSQAYVGPPYFGPNQSMGEHPWQDSQSPPEDDNNTPEISSRITIVFGPARAIILRVPWTKSRVEMARQAPGEFGIRHGTKTGND
jgi:hypothetical protein